MGHWWNHAYRSRCRINISQDISIILCCIYFDRIRVRTCDHSFHFKTQKVKQYCQNEYAE
jgi:hypothetical protein